jgi:hypothetical protein
MGTDRDASPEVLLEAGSERSTGQYILTLFNPKKGKNGTKK